VHPVLTAIVVASRDAAQLASEFSTDRLLDTFVRLVGRFSNATTTPSDI
jgi:hypothetical protein